MPTVITPSQIDVSDLIEKAEKTFASDVYANHIQVTLTANELLLDFYYISPQPHKAEPVKMLHIGRMISPVGMAKGLATALANVVANHEAAHDLVLPNLRTPNPEDKITIWP